MTTKKARAGKTKTPRSPRISITFPADLYQTLEVVAKDKKVSLAWVVREASERYAADQKPAAREAVRRTSKG
jgi:metal-responsive CopG/Arc/MetJ family transcriptional regulator